MMRSWESPRFNPNPGTPEDVAPLAVYLAGRGSDFVTGQVLGTTKLPVAGVNDLWILSVSVLSGFGGLALLLKK